MNRQERIIVFLLAALNFTHILDFMIIMPLSNTLIESFGITTGQFSLIVSAYSYSAFATGFVAAFFIDNFDRKRSLLFGYAGFIIGTFLCGIATSYVFLIIARILAGLFGGLIGAQVLSILADTFPYEKRGQAMGYMMAAFSIASVIGVPLGLYLATLLNWHAPFLLIVGLGLILFPLTMKFLPPMTGHLQHKSERRPADGFRAVFTDKTAIIALFFSACLMLGHFIVIPFITPYMEFNVGFTDKQIPLIYVVGGFATLFTAPMAGKLADRYGKLKVYTICSLATLPLVYMISNMPPIPFYFVLGFTAIWFVMSNGRSVASQAIISNVVAPQHRGSFMSINSSLQQLFVGSASLIAGLIVTNDASRKIHHFDRAGWLSIGILTFCIGLGYLLRHADTGVSGPGKKE